MKRGGEDGTDSNSEGSIKRPKDEGKEASREKGETEEARYQMRFGGSNESKR